MPSVSAIAHHLLSEPGERDKINKILDRPEIQEAVNAPRKIVRKFDVPYLAGSAKDGAITYIDRRVPTDIKIGDKTADPAKYLNIHEQTEHALMTEGKMKYEDAHSIATQKEREAVEGDGLNWKDYERTLDGFLDETEHEKPKNPPPDLYVKPYPHDKQKLLEKAGEREESKSTPAQMAVILIHGRKA